MVTFNYWLIVMVSSASWSYYAKPRLQLRMTLYSPGKRAKLLIRSLSSRARVRTEMKRKRYLVDAEPDTENKKADYFLILKVRIKNHELRYFKLSSQAEHSDFLDSVDI